MFNPISISVPSFCQSNGPSTFINIFSILENKRPATVFPFKNVESPQSMKNRDPFPNDSDPPLNTDNSLNRGVGRAIIHDSDKETSFVLLSQLEAL